MNEPQMPRRGPSEEELSPGLHVVMSELAVEAAGTDALEAAFRDRLGEVDSYPGHRGLQVWRDDRHEGRYLMISWWDNPTVFREYMRSEAHHRSHDRIPTEPARARPVHVDQFTLIGT